MIPNPNYQRPPWKRVKLEVDRLRTTTQKINYLERLLATDEQEAVLPPEEYWGWSQGDEGWEMSPAGGLPEVTSDDLKYFEMETESWRERVQRELEVWRRQLPEDQATRRDVEAKFGEARLIALLTGTEAPQEQVIYWDGDQESFTAWLRESYEEFLSSEPPDPYARKNLYKTVVRLLAPLFYYYDNGGTRQTFTVGTIERKPKDAVNGKPQAERIAGEARAAGRPRSMPRT